MGNRKKLLITVIAVLAVACIGAVASSAAGVLRDHKRIIRISDGQPEEHPDNVGLEAFKEYVEENLGDKYEVQIYPNELLGSSQKAIELVQTGAIDYVVASTSNLETFNDVYQIFSIPYLFTGEDGFTKVMNDDAFMKKIYDSTEESGFEAVTWFKAGVRNIYTTKPVHSVRDLKGMKIRVQASPTNVKMIDMLGASAVPMSYGEVYTAIQQGVVDGAENSEMALTTMKHGEVAKYYTYTQHQIVPDMLVANASFLNGLPEDERKIFDEAARIANEKEIEAWDKQIEEAKKTAQDEMNVHFEDVDITPFREKVLPLHEEVLKSNPKLRPYYDEIQKIQGSEGGAK